jgi:gamma-glutamylcyclotransferase (GGCT)/AIG2-like uncharacterized protein YtfP
MYKILSLDEIRELINENEIEQVLSFMFKKEYLTLSNNFLFVYGSLRKDEYNYNRIRTNYGGDSFMYICSASVNQISLYDAGSYPIGIGESLKDGSFKLAGDLMFCSNNARNSIDTMELSAGYKICSKSINVETTTFNNKSSEILLIDTFVADKSLEKYAKENYKLVTSGDWTKYLREVM